MDQDKPEAGNLNRISDLFPAGDKRPDENYPIRIGTDGTWYYHGSPIGRMELVRLFASVLRRDEKGDYWLITPAERGRIQVDDAPFVAVELTAEGEGPNQRLTFTTNLGAQVMAGPRFPLRNKHHETSDESVPYLSMENGLEARINRAVYYQLADLAVADPKQPDTLGVWSDGAFFALGGATR